MKISVIVPCRNEEKFIANTLESLINQSFPIQDYEILVVDGLSEDNTQNIINNFLDKYSNLSLYINEKKITPSAMNIGIKNAKGEVIVICGAHAIYSKEFLSEGYELLKKNQNFDCVGGPIISDGTNAFSKAVSLAMSSIIGVGNAKHRFPEYEGFAEMACFPFFRKEVFSKIGLYDESLVRNQDDEFCMRLRQHGGKVYLSPKVKSIYLVRDHPKKLMRQYFNYGVWRFVVLRMYKQPISFRQLIPSVFILFNIFILFLGIILKSWLLSISILLFYFLALLFFSIPVNIKYGLRIGSLFILAVIILHFSYGFGLLYAPFKNKQNY